MTLTFDILWTIGGALVTIATSAAFVKMSLKEQAGKIERLEKGVKEIHDDFLTRREYELRMQAYDLRLQHINENVQTILNILTNQRIAAVKTRAKKDEE
jgi:hypothetical protein